MMVYRISLASLIGVLFLLFLAVGRFPNSASRSQGAAALPAHLAHLPGILYMRSGREFVPAPQELVQLAQSYPTFPDKGLLRGGVRCTIMADKTDVVVGETVRVIHCVEVPTPGTVLFIMGPKPVFDEFVNGRNMCPNPRLLIQFYNGMVERGPAIDFNYDPTSYCFQTPGVYRIWWGGGSDPLSNFPWLRSNLIIIRVRERPHS